jgi:hypothetical protein
MSGFERRVTLSEWIDTISRDPDRGILTAISCKHLVGGPYGTQTGDEVGGLTFVQGKPWDVKETALFFQSRCQTYAQDLPGTQRFKLFAYFGSPEPAAFFHIEVTGRTLYEHGETEEATDRGSRGQGMRLTELIVGKTFSKDNELWNMAKILLTEMKQDRDEHRQEARESFGIIKELLQEKIANVHEQKMKELEFERSTQERKKLILLLPAIVNFVTGKKIMGEGNADTAILQTAAEVIRKLPPADKTRALEMMPPELAIVMGARLKELADQQEVEEQATRLLASANTADDESDLKELDNGTRAPELERH